MKVSQNLKEHMFHHLKWLSQRLTLDVHGYLAIYKTNLEVYDRRFGMSELQFIEVDLVEIKRFICYIPFVNNQLPNKRTKDIVFFERMYKIWLPVIQEIIHSNELTIENHNRRKIDFLERRKLEINKINEIAFNHSSVTLQGFEPIVLTDNFSIGEFVNIFFLLHQSRKIISSTINLTKLLAAIIKDNATMGDVGTHIRTVANLLETVLNEKDINSSSNSQNGYEALILTSDCSINYIPTLFYNLKRDSKIDSSDKNLIRILLHILRDKKNQLLKENTLNDIFNHSKTLARSKKV
ncbi:hypothetical protein NAF17_11355 [Mucilaginibacter sp. RB4R14]|uniref:hypothetical protein n=1 Tax=Mucilaginibacter aurantiaciroseus TaxID=2949308 RepID=UPI002090E838|nr:hypothetical protein [Mucilaginibacter aurantiaciroseus]MCO5936136.1 hypothetical protein [Mucilaginibacter aurantiaciroseus]